MVDLSLNLKAETKEKLKKLIDQYPDAEILANSIIGYETAELKKGIINLQIGIKNLEKNITCPRKNLYSKLKPENWEMNRIL